jgi:hypothetical protein
MIFRTNFSATHPPKEEQVCPDFIGCLPSSPAVKGDKDSQHRT